MPTRAPVVNPLPPGEGWRRGCQRTTLAGSWTRGEHTSQQKCSHARTRKLCRSLEVKLVCMLPRGEGRGEGLPRDVRQVDFFTPLRIKSCVATPDTPPTPRRGCRGR